MSKAILVALIGLLNLSTAYGSTFCRNSASMPMKPVTIATTPVTTSSTVTGQDDVKKH